MSDSFNILFALVAILIASPFMASKRHPYNQTDRKLWHGKRHKL